MALSEAQAYYLYNVMRLPRGAAVALFNGRDGEWQSGAGLGLRYKTPIGPIRLDVAAPVQGSTGGGVQLYLGIGQAF